MFLHKIYISRFFLLCFPQILECYALQIFCPLLNFQSVEISPVFPVFLGKKQRKSGGKKLYVKNGPFFVSPTASAVHPVFLFLLYFFHVSRTSLAFCFFIAVISFFHFFFFFSNFSVSVCDHGIGNSVG